MQSWMREARFCIERSERNNESVCGIVRSSGDWNKNGRNATVKHERYDLLVFRSERVVIRKRVGNANHLSVHFGGKFLLSALNSKSSDRLFPEREHQELTSLLNNLFAFERRYTKRYSGQMR